MMWHDDYEDMEKLMPAEEKARLAVTLSITNLFLGHPGTLLRIQQSINRLLETGERNTGLMNPTP